MKNISVPDPKVPDYHTIDKHVEEILPVSGLCPDGLDTIIEKRKGEWAGLSAISHSIVLVFDCYRNKFVFVSDNIPALFGIDPQRLILEGHIPVLEIMHPDDICFGLLIRKKIYALLNDLSPADKMKYKIVHEMRVRNLTDGYIRIIEQEQVAVLDDAGSVWLMLSVIDMDAGCESEVTRSHLYNFETGEQVFIDLSDTLEEALTSRESEVLALMKQGMLSKEIAAVLNVSIHTINSHRQGIMRKLNANNTIEAVNFAQRLGLLRDNRKA